MSSTRRAGDRGDSKRDKEVPKQVDDVEQWTAVANKLDIDDATATATEKALLSDALAAVKKQAAELDETRWLYEDMPATPEALEASAGL